MKTLILLLFSICMHTGVKAFAQKITLSEKNASLDKIFREVKMQTGYTFVYTDLILRKAKKVNVEVSNATLEQTMDLCFKDQPLTYTIVNMMVVVKEKEQRVPQQQQVTAAAALVSVTGKVSGSTGEPLARASIGEKGTTNATFTKDDGSFSLNVSGPNAILVVSYVGFLTKELSVGGQPYLSIVLEQSSANLNDVVVVGYGSLKRKDLTGSVSSVSGKDIQDLSVTRVDQALLGKVAGVQAKPVSGEPGAAMQIRVRGIGSISAGVTPLYVVDGLPTSSIETLNPNDIESMDILKDASATAIYGSRGSNGVVIINTKRGKAGKTMISFDTYVGLQQVSKRPEFMNSKQQAQYLFDGYRNRNIDAGNDVSGTPDKWKVPVPKTALDVLDGTNTTETDALNDVLRTAPVQHYQLSASGGTEKVRYALSGEYLNQDGIIINSNFKRYSVRANIDAQLTKRLSVKLNMNPSYTDAHVVSASGTGTGPAESVIGMAAAANPFYPLYDTNGNYFVYTGRDASADLLNPVALAKEILNRQKGMRFLGNVGARYDIMDGLNFNVMMGGSYQSGRGLRFKPNLPAFLNNPALGTDNTSMISNWLSEYTLNYDKSFGKHHITALLGYTAQKEIGETNTLTSDKYPNNLVPTLSAVSGLFTNGSSDMYQWSIVSTLGRINYNYNSKYYITASLRRDGSSRFGADNKYALFPSAALAWRVSDENFLKDVNWLSELKLRVSYGETGNNNIGNYDQFATITYEKYALGGTAIGGYAPGRLANPNLTWEKQRSVNTGVDMSFFDRRLMLSVDRFQSRNTDLLLNVNVPDITGFSTALKNIGEVKNTGWEFVVSTVNVDQKFKWNTSFNVSTYKNEVVRLGPNGDPIISDGNITMIGQPIGMFYGWITDGVFMNQAELDKGPIFSPGASDRSRLGDTRFKDISGPDGKPDGVIDSRDKTIMGSPYPDFYYGMTNNFSYQGFTLSVGLQGTQGNKILSMARLGTVLTKASIRQLTTSLDYWKSEQEPGDGNTPRPNNLVTGNTRGLYNQRFLDEGSYLRINNITLGYLLPSKVSTRLGLNALRFYVNATNPFIFTKNTAFNPDVSNSENPLNPGVDLNNYPLPKSMIVGLNVTF
jgi:TonB-linked SusC/RagA family outer membrane protein